MSATHYLLPSAYMCKSKTSATKYSFRDTQINYTVTTRVYIALMKYYCRYNDTKYSLFCLTNNLILPYENTK
jgi:hypothetical protein